MKERPILFSAPMVRAILAGTKTQTRRIIKPRDLAWMDEHQGLRETDNAIRCPYGLPGDRLWVRETWAHDAESVEQCRASYEDAMCGGEYGPYYRATETAPDTLHWRPSIHMPRWASRILLEVTGVRVERLQDISEADALAEGVRDGYGEPFDAANTISDRRRYELLWEQINGAGSWAANPWVWVVAFKRIDGGAANG